MTKYRIGVQWDADFVATGCDGRQLPESSEVYAEAPMLRGDGSEMPYADYCAYYGDPERHIGAAVVVDRMRPEDRDWVRVTGLYDIDLMDDSPEASEVPVGGHTTRWYYPDRLPVGYLGEVARELLQEAGYGATE